jgi:hypothetical protein
MLVGLKIETIPVVGKFDRKVVKAVQEQAPLLEPNYTPCIRSSLLAERPHRLRAECEQDVDSFCVRS